MMAMAPPVDVSNDLLDYKLFGGVTQHQVQLVVAGLLMIGIFAWAARSMGGKPKKTGPLALLEYGLVWVRDEVVYPWLGPERGRKYLPLLWTMFFFLLFSNVMGLIPLFSPFYPGDHTDALTVATADIAVTAGFAAITFLVVQAAGIKEHGFGKYLRNLIPPGLPAFVIPIVLIVEFLGLFTKPFALTVRLFANMLAGHALLAILFGFLIGIEHYAHPVAGMPETIASAAFLLFIMLFETLIALIQAYIFTVLSAIFISISVSHEH